MIESLDFYFDGISSVDMGVRQVTTESGLFNEQFIAPKRINEEKIRGNDKSYLLGVERDSLSFPLTLWFENGFDEEKLNEIAFWLDQNQYKPFYTADNPDRIFYCMSTDSSEHIHNGIQQGYLKLNMKCNVPYTVTPVYDETHDFSTNTTSGMDLTFINNGIWECKPFLTIKMLEDGDLSIVNTSDGGREFKFTGLSNGETVRVDNEMEDIESDIPGVWRYDSFNDNYLTFPRGYNYLKVYGKCQLEFKYRFKTR